MGIFGTLKARYRRAKDPVGYWRSLGAVIGEDCEIYPQAAFGSEPYLIRLGDHVRITNGVKLITHDGGVWVLRQMYPELADVDIVRGITIGDNVHIGMDATIMPGVRIGSNCVIGCGAVVTKDIPDNSIAVGVPARVIETVEEYAKKHAEDFIHTKHMSPEEKKRYLQSRD